MTPFALTTVHQQQQHLAFLRADEAALQNKATHEVENFDRHVALLKHFFLHFVDEFIGGNEDGADSSQNTHGDFKYRNLLVRKTTSTSRNLVDEDMETERTTLGAPGVDSVVAGDLVGVSSP